ncbi:MAG: oxidoreductase [Actinobacteria bacterium]|nr:oxidoreductase [Actinomycetota bacterium]
MTVLVARNVCQEAVGVRSFRFEHPDGGALEPWEPGAHLEFTLPSGLVRHYSLCGDPEDRTGYTVAVLEQPDGRGGSREFHKVVVGAEVAARGPRNHFPLGDAEAYLFIAGGIGITPILPMIRAVAKSGKDFRVVYGGRTRASMAFADEVSGFGDAACLVPEDVAGRIDIAGEVAGRPEGTQVYCCGPEPLLSAVRAVCGAERRVGAVHFERFGGAGEARMPVAGGVFEVELARTGVTVSVDPGSTILDKVLEAVADHPWACREGFCGSCETAVLSGEPEHADEVLSEAERQANNVMMICVGRSRSRKLVLDI